MPPIQLLIKPVSGTCNLKCSYCFYCDEMEKREKANYGFMSEGMLETAVKETLRYARGRCGFAFQGGEPTLAGLPFYRKLLEFQEKYNTNKVSVTNAIQTNGYGITREWAQFLAENHFLVGVSLDGTKYTHDAYRRTPQGEGTFARIMDGIALLEKHHAEFNILTVVNRRTAQAVSKLYSFYQKHGWRYLQFIPCLDPMGEEPGEREYSLTPKMYGEFLCRLFDLWYEDLKKGKQPYIRLFENYIAILMGYEAEACDQRGCCSVQYVTEADGSVYACDFYVTDEFYLGRFGENSLEEMRRKGEELGFDGRERAGQEACLGCPCYRLCRGGCRRHWSRGRNYFCPGFRAFFQACLPRMLEIAKKL
ncbi:MAG: anaerobic sulfatase maturase [Clostridium sp.]|nr:anaerobic sulfatase maturase [Clostridium sp.]